MSSSSSPLNLLVIGEVAQVQSSISSRLPSNIRLVEVPTSSSSNDVLNPYTRMDAATLSTVDIVLCQSGQSRLILSHLWPQLTTLKWVHSTHTGLDTLLFPELITAATPSSPSTTAKVTLSNSRGLLSPALAEWALFAMLHFAKQAEAAIRAQAAKLWTKLSINMLRGQTLSIVGYGDIGQEIGRLALAFGMRVIGLRRSHKSDSTSSSSSSSSSSTSSASSSSSSQLTVVSLDSLHSTLAVSDYVVCCLPASPDTFHLINEAAFNQMRPHTVFVNIGRGNTVDEQQLVQRLRDGKLAGAALDVYETEPLPSSSELYKVDASKLLLYSHCANNIRDTFAGGMTMFVEHVHDYVNKGPLSLKNRVARPDQGY